MRFLAILAILVGFTACQTKDETISGQVTSDTIWVLETFKGQPVSSRITIAFPEQGQLSGQAPCNNYFAAQKAPLPWFEAGPIGATKRACPELSLESDYFNTLTKATQIEVTGDTLVLSDDSDVLLVFKKTS